MEKSENYRAVEALLRSLGVSCVNVSVRQFISALELLHMDAALIEGLTKRLYPKIAELYPEATWSSVERNLRSARDAIVTQGDPERLMKIMGRKVHRHVSVADMLDSVNYYLDFNRLWPDSF